MDVSILVTNYNARGALEACLRSALAQCGPGVEVIVVDDASHDGSAEMVRERFPGARLIVNERNLGYARSCNQALPHCRGPFVLLLNNDAVLQAGAVECLRATLAANPHIDAAGCLLFNGDGTIQANAAKALPSWRTPLFGYRSLLSRWFPRNRFTRSELVCWKAEGGQPFAADFISGAATMVRASVLRDLGGLDAGFFHFIDADMCRRIRDRGGEVCCVPAARAVHYEHHGGSMAGRGRRFRTIVDFHLGAYRYFRKHCGRSAVHPLHLLVVGGLSLRFTMSSLVQAVREIVPFIQRRERTT